MLDPGLNAISKFYIFQEQVLTGKKRADIGAAKQSILIPKIKKNTGTKFGKGSNVHTQAIIKPHLNTSRYNAQTLFSKIPPMIVIDKITEKAITN